METWKNVTRSAQCRVSVVIPIRTQDKYERKTSFLVDKRAETNDKGADNMDSDHNALQQLKQQAIGDNDQLGDLLDLNSEPAVEDLMRQIMSQAKLWEAIQEANREMVIQKDVRDANTKEHFPLAFSAQWSGEKLKIYIRNDRVCRN